MALHTSLHIHRPDIATTKLLVTEERKSRYNDTLILLLLQSPFFITTPILHKVQTEGLFFERPHFPFLPQGPCTKAQGTSYHAGYFFSGYGYFPNPDVPGMV